MDEKILYARTRAGARPSVSFLIYYYYYQYLLLSLLSRCPGAILYYLPQRFQKIVDNNVSVFHFWASLNIRARSGSTLSSSPSQNAVKLSATYSFRSAVAYADMPVA